MILRRLVASGWWIAPAAVAASAAVVTALLLSAPRQEANPGDSTLAVEPALEPSLVPPEEIVDAGLLPHGLPALDHPAVLSLENALGAEHGRGKLLVSGDRVVGVAVGGEARAYPLRLLRWHEVVNDTVGGVELAVAYSPLADSVAVFRRTPSDPEARFRVSGLLYQSSHLLADLGAPPSLWSPLLGRAVTGPAAAAGETLELLPGDLDTWQGWRERHPHTTVLAPDPELARRYRRDPYHSYFGSDVLRFPVEPLPPETVGLRLKDRVVVVGAPGQEEVFALPRLAAAVGAPEGTWATEVGGAPLEIGFRVEPGTARVEVLDPAHGPVPVRHAFWFAWYATHPGSVPRP